MTTFFTILKFSDDMIAQKQDFLYGTMYGVKTTRVDLQQPSGFRRSMTRIDLELPSGLRPSVTRIDLELPSWLRPGWPSNASITSQFVKRCFSTSWVLTPSRDMQVKLFHQYTHHSTLNTWAVFIWIILTRPEVTLTICMIWMPQYLPRTAPTTTLAPILLTCTMSIQSLTAPEQVLAPQRIKTGTFMDVKQVHAALGWVHSDVIEVLLLLADSTLMS